MINIVSVEYCEADNKYIGVWKSGSYSVGFILTAEDAKKLISKNYSDIETNRRYETWIFKETPVTGTDSTVTRHIKTDSWMKFGYEGRTPIATEISQAEAEQIILTYKGRITESKNAEIESWHIDLVIIPQSMMNLKF